MSLSHSLSSHHHPVRESISMSATVAKCTSAIFRRKKKTKLLDLNNDCLRSIVEEVFFTSRTSLFRLSAVNTRFYYLSVPWIYRNVFIDYEEVSQLLLLKRLVHKGSILPSFVRDLEITPSWRPPLWFLWDVIILIRRLTRLRTLTWNTFANIVPFLHHELARFPKAKLIVQGSVLIDYTMVIGMKPETPIYTIAPNSRPIFAGHQLTEFVFDVHMYEQIYPEFKQDLLSMLTRCPSLEKLSLLPRFHSDRQFSKLGREFQWNLLPNLKHLCLRRWSSLVFDEDELRLWGEHTGWTKLQYLNLDMEAFPGIMGKAPALETLELGAVPGWNLTNLLLELDVLELDFPDLYLHNYPDDFLQPSVTTFYEITPLDRLLSTMEPHPGNILPIKLLATMPNLLKMGIYATYTFSEDVITDEILEVKTPPASDISELRRVCPLLRNLAIDISLDNDWPLDVLEEVSRFRDLDRVSLHLHFLEVRIAVRAMKRWRCEQVFSHMIRTRAKEGLPIGPLTVKFLVVRFTEDHEIRDGMYMPDIVVWNWMHRHFPIITQSRLISWKDKRPEEPRTRMGSFEPHKFTLDGMSDAELKAIEDERLRLFGSKRAIFLHPWAYQRAEEELRKARREMQRREMEKTGGRPGNVKKLVTLFDAWNILPGQDRENEEAWLERGSEMNVLAMQNTARVRLFTKDSA